MNDPRRLLPDARAELVARMAEGAGVGRPEAAVAMIGPKKAPLEDLEFYRESELIRRAANLLGIDDPFLRPHEGIGGAETRIDGRTLVNFSSYNYLGLNGHPEVAEAAKAAIDQYGASTSASRVVAGERPLHAALEAALAAMHGAEACVAMVSGHATNVTVVGHMMRRDDLVLHDALAHNSIVQGALLSGARRFSFPHNDHVALRELLSRHARTGRRTLVVVESHYSMDGDTPDLPLICEAAKDYGAWLMVDEAHAIGVLGERGHGAAEHFGLAPGDVDIWMGTLSKTLAGCGGYIAASADLVRYLKLTAPGFVYSVGLSPPLAAASLAALKVMNAEPQRISRLRANARRFRDRAAAAGLDVGLSQGFAIVPVIVGSSIAAGRLAQALLEREVNVQPILFPAIPERSARLRFFLSSEHSEAQIDAAVALVAEEAERVGRSTPDLANLAAQLNA